MDVPATSIPITFLYSFCVIGASPAMPLRNHGVLSASSISVFVGDLMVLVNKHWLSRIL